MTKREHQIVKRAVLNLMAEDGAFSSAIADLCRLVGWVYPAGELGDMPAVDLRTLMEATDA